LSQTISQTEKASFQLFSFPLICSVINITLQIKWMPKTQVQFITATKKKSSATWILA